MRNVYALSIGTQIDDHEWPLSEIQGQWFHKTDNISETVEYRAKVTINGLYKVVGL